MACLKQWHFPLPISFLSGCVAKELIESGHSVIYFSATGLFDLLSKNSFDYKNREEKSKKLGCHELIRQFGAQIVDDQQITLI